MIAVDSSAVVAILKLEPDARPLLSKLVAAKARAMSAVNMLETALVLAGPSGTSAIWGPLDAFIAEAGIEVVPFDATQMVEARQAFLTFGKGRHPAGLNFGDCASYALAATRRVPLLFKGEDFSKTDVMQIT